MAQFFKNPSRDSKKNRRVFYILGFVLIGVLVSVSAYYLSNNNLDNRNSAAEPDSQVFNRNVLLIGFNPVENGESAAEHFYPRYIGNKTPEQFETEKANGVIDAFQRISDGTINYNIAEHIQIEDFPTYPNGFQYDFGSYAGCVDGSDAQGCESRKWTFDEVAWVQDNNICQIAEANNVDEIWVFSLQYVMTYEAFMIGPTESFGINGPTFAISGCEKQYPVVNPVYDRSENFLHDFGHRFEATMSYLTSPWADSERKKYWEDFANMSCYRQSSGMSGCNSGSFCGNTHFAHNSEGAYDVDNKRAGESRCVDWQNIPNFTGETQTINCDAWGCLDSSWQEFWFSYIPRQQGSTQIALNNGSSIDLLNNWWYYLLIPENTIDCVETGNCLAEAQPNPDPTSTTTTTVVTSTTILPSTTTTTMSGSSRADLNNDGQVNMSDYSLFAYSYKSARRGRVENPIADLDNNNSVNMDDYEIFTEEYLNYRHEMPAIPL